MPIDFCNCSKKHKEASCSHPNINNKCPYKINKNANSEEEFTKELKKYIDSNNQQLCFEGLHFPEKAKNFFKGQTLNKANFDSARFPKDISFSRTIFKEKVSFQKAIFNDINFDNATFKKDCFFSEAKFKGYADFKKCRFEGEAHFGEIECKEPKKLLNFNGAIFNKESWFIYKDEEKDIKLSFKDAEFKAECLFRNCNFSELDFSSIKNNKKILFDGNCNMKNVSLMDVDLSKFEFINVEWGKMKCYNEIKYFDNIPVVNWIYIIKKSIFGERNCVWDEKDIKGLFKKYKKGDMKKKEYQESVETVKNIYQQLKKNEQSRRNYAQASDWHYGEMEMRLWKNVSWWQRHLSIIYFYRLLSGYGERYIRAISVWILMVFIISAINVIIGFKTINYPDNSKKSVKKVASIKAANSKTAKSTKVAKNNDQLIVSIYKKIKLLFDYSNDLQSFVYTIKLFTFQRIYYLYPGASQESLFISLVPIIGVIQTSLLVLSIKRHVKR